MKKLAKLQISIKNEKLEFLNKLITFLDILEDNDRLRTSYDAAIKIREFFNFCFVEFNCPKLMWIYTMKLFEDKHKENIEIFKEIKYDDYKNAFDVHCSNEVVISKRKIFNQTLN